jgi:CRP/FNR family cyclic AMP-dependent transcriptional regulator
MSPFWSNLHFFSRADDAVDRRLKAAPMFHELSDRALREVRDACHLRDYKSGEHIFREEEPGVGVYVILDGTVEIYRKGEKGREWHFAELEGGDFFGELALLEEMPRTASAMAKTPCRILGFFPPRSFEHRGAQTAHWSPDHDEHGQTHWAASAAGKQPARAADCE